MKRSDIISIATALDRLDTYPKVVKDGQGNEVVAHIPFAFNGKTRMQIARARAAVKAEREQFMEARQGIIKQHAEGKEELKAGTPEFTKAEDEIKGLLNEDVQLDIPTIDEAGLALDTNNIAPSVVEALLPILKG